jgi:hypothetical protein
MSITRLSFFGILSYLLLMVVLSEMNTSVPRFQDTFVIINGYACSFQSAIDILALLNARIGNIGSEATK